MDMPRGLDPIKGCKKSIKEKKDLIFDSTFEGYSELSIILKVGGVFYATASRLYM